MAPTDLQEAIGPAREEHRFRAIIDTIPAQVWCTRSDGSAEFLNRRWLEYTGLSLEQAIDWGWTAALHPDERDRIVDYWRLRLSSGQSAEIELRLRRFDGSYRWFLSRGNPVRDASGTVVKWCGTNTDIDDRRRGEDAARASERDARLILDSIPGHINTTTAAGDVEFANQRMLDYFGVTLAELQQWEPFIHPDDLARTADVWSRAVETGHPFEHENRLRRADGAYRWFHARALPIRDSAGRIIRWFNLNTDIDDQRRAEAALRASEHDFHSIVDRIPGLVCTMKPTGEIESLNRQILDYFGRSVNDLRQWAMTDAVHPDDLPRAIEGWTRAIELGERYQIEVRLRRADGAYRWFHLDALPVRDVEGRVLRWYDLLTDIEERKRVDEQLRRSEAFLLEAQRLSQTGSWRHDASLGTVTITPELHRIFAISPDEDASTAEFFFGRIHPEDRAAEFDNYATAQQTKRDFQSHYRIVLPDGSIRHIHNIGHPVLNESDEITAFVGTARDVTLQVEARAELERASAALRAREHQLRLMVDSIPGLICVMTAAGEVDVVNQTFLDYAGKTLEEFDSWQVVVHPEDMPVVQRELERSLQAESPVDLELRIRRSDDVYRWFHCRGLPLRGADGQVVSWYKLLTDIHDRKKAEEALGRTQARLARATQVATVGEMAASIAHEVNQPLAAVVANGHACLRWLAAEPPNLEKTRQTIARIVSDGTDAGEVVRRVRSLFKRGDMPKVALDLNDVIAEMLRLVDSERARRGVALVTDFGTALPPVLGDRIELQQLVHNLLLNGLEAMDPVVDRPKTLSIRSSRHSNEMAQVEIRDNGVGLKEPDKAFEAFFTTKENGMGLGLAICRSIVEAHGGRLWTAPTDGPGASFCFTLPFGPTAAP